MPRVLENATDRRVLETTTDVRIVESEGPVPKIQQQTIKLQAVNRASTW